MDAALEYIHSFPRFNGRSGIKPGLERMEALLKRLGNPERSLRFLHVAGTNGKGSVCAFLASMLQANGYRTGLYTSPYITHFSDRMSINGKEIDGKLLNDLIEMVKPHIGEIRMTPLGEPTEFEVITLLAILFFAREKVDLVVWETGLGGRLDATNVVKPLVSVITNVALDHMHILGSTVSEIAAEKAGIIKEGVPLVTAAEGDALAVITAKAQGKNSPLYVYGRDFTYRREAYNWDGQVLTYTGLQGKGERLAIGMLGEHQCVNATLALAVMEILMERGYIINPQGIREGFACVRWPGRLEKIQEQPIILLDGAHNPHGALALAKSLRELLKGERLIVVIGILEDKVVPDLIRPWLPLAHQVIVTEPNTPRKGDARQVAQLIRELQESEGDHLPGNPISPVIEPVVALACQRAQSIASKTDVIVITGSLYTISEARNFLLAKDRSLEGSLEG